MPHAHHLPPLHLFEDQPAVDHPIEDQPPPTVHLEEPQIPVSTAPSVTAPLPTSPASSAPLVPPTPSDSTGPNTSTPPLQHISRSPRHFLAIMDVVHTFSAMFTSFVAAHTTLAERMTRTKAVVAQTTALLSQNHAILVQIQSHLGLPPISPPVPTHASSVHPPSKLAAPTHPAPPAALLDLLAATAVADTPPVSSTAP